MFNDEADIRGRERFHGIGSRGLTKELEGALLTVSALAKTSRGIYLRAAVPPEAKAEAAGMLNESEAPKRPCGFSGVLCANRHGALCAGAWSSLRTLAEAWARVMPSGIPPEIAKQLPREH